MSERICPTCHAGVVETVTHVPVVFFTEPPQQAEPYVCITVWQCLRNESHHGRRLERGRAERVLGWVEGSE